MNERFPKQGGFPEIVDALVWQTEFFSAQCSQEALTNPICRQNCYQPVRGQSKVIPPSVAQLSTKSSAVIGNVIKAGLIMYFESIYLLEYLFKFDEFVKR